MKEFKPELMVAAGRYQNCFPTLPEKIKSSIYSRMMELLEEEKDYCDEGAKNKEG